MTTGTSLRLQDFEGRWSLSRVITDRRAGTTARFDGSATFTPVAGALSYFETGTLRIDGQPPIHAERRYLWRQDGDRIVIAFEDGREFHDFTATSPDASHWCDPDTYTVRYDFADWPIWTSTWQVSGPRKDYDMSTRYHRAAD